MPQYVTGIKPCLLPWDNYSSRQIEKVNDCDPLCSGSSQNRLSTTIVVFSLPLVGAPVLQGPALPHRCLAGP